MHVISYKIKSCTQLAITNAAHTPYLQRNESHLAPHDIVVLHSSANTVSLDVVCGMHAVKSLYVHWEVNTS